MKRRKLEAYYARVDVIAANSPDKQTKVGAILIHGKTGAVISEGYNGFIRGAPDKHLPDTRPEKYKYMIHAETNLLCNAVRHGVSTDGCVVFCTISPCIHCLRMLYQAGIRVVYFKERYKDFDECADMGDLKISSYKEHGFHKISLSPRKKRHATN